MDENYDFFVGTPSVPRNKKRRESVEAVRVFGEALLVLVDAVRLRVNIEALRVLVQAGRVLVESMISCMLKHTLK
jgi:hypothetical protein